MLLQPQHFPEPEIARFRSESPLPALPAEISLSTVYQNLRNPPSPINSPQLYDYIDGLADVGLDLSKCQRRSCVQDHDRQTVDGEFSRLGMDGGDRSTMAGIDCFEISEGLGATQLANDNPVRAHAEGGLQQCVGRPLAVMVAFGQQRDRIWLGRK